MPPGPTIRRRCLAAAGLAVLLQAAAPEVSQGQREHTVRPGQTLSRIATRYGVTPSMLAAANGVSPKQGLRPGQILVVPRKGVVYVTEGQSLASIAHRHDVTVAELARLNDLSQDSPLRVGQELALPGQEAASRAQGPADRWGRPRQRGRVTLYRAASQERRTLQLVDRRGRVRAAASAQLERLLRPRGSRRGRAPHPRLVRLLARVSDHFGGRPLHVISGYRKPGGNTKKTSRHVAGQAVDFRIEGVPLEELRSFCERLEHVGVGYYPTSRFVHLDVRQTSARWTDWSGPGEAPRKEPSNADSFDAQDEPAAEDDGLDPVDDGEG